MFIGVATFVAGALSHKKGYLNVGLNDIIETNINIPVNYLSSLFMDIEELKLDIEHIDYQKLAYTRDRALSDGFLSDDIKEYVPLDVTYKGSKIKAKIRLKGSLPDHWSDDKKWSFRIKLRDDKTIEGMKNFSIQHPKVRGYLNEWFYSKLNQSEGVLSSRYHFTHLFVNGEDYGIYAIEEHFDKRLLESQDRREGPIIRFGTSEYAYYDNLIETYSNLEVRKEERPMFQQATNLLEGLRRGEFDVNQVFEIDVLAKYFAISDIVYGMHATAAHNIRFYYNPISSKLEPIAYDAEILQHEDLTLQGVIGQHKFNFDKLKFRELIKNPSLYFHFLIFNDPNFFSKYIQYLEDFSNTSFLDVFFDKHGNELIENINKIHRSFPHINFKKSIYYNRQKQIKRLLNDRPNIIAYKPKISEGHIIIPIENESGFPLEVTGLKYNSRVFEIDSVQLIESRLSGSESSIYYQRFIIPSDILLDSISSQHLLLSYKILGSTKEHSSKVQFYSPLGMSSDNGLDIHRMNANFREFDWITYNEEIKEIYFKNGSWTLDKTLIIPSGYTVMGEAPLTINLVNGSHILSYSPMILRGADNDVIKITSSDSTSAGLSVINAKAYSKMDLVDFDNLSMPRIGNWSLPGAITFYQSPVKFSNCNFLSNREGDDYVNIFRSSFELNKCNFQDTYADALDLDFSDGQVLGCNFFNIGNDAIDASGSNILVDNGIISNVLDKAISSGENSQIKSDNLRIRNSEIAFAAKDNSTLHVSNTNISKSTIGFTAFQKKPEFGPAIIYANDVIQNDIEINYLIEKNSRFYIDSVNIKSNEENIKKLMYGIKYGRSSK
jgi:hypothetical protein